MNRKKKINSILKSKLKKQNAKLHKSNKPRYISKAEREKNEADQAIEQSDVDTPVTQNEQQTLPSEQ